MFEKSMFTRRLHRQTGHGALVTVHKRLSELLTQRNIVRATQHSEQTSNPPGGALGDAVGVQELWGEGGVAHEQRAAWEE